MLGKPIETDPKLLKLLEKSKEWYKNASQEEKDRMHKAQKESWVRANMSTGDPRFD